MPKSISPGNGRTGWRRLLPWGRKKPEPNPTPLSSSASPHGNDDGPAPSAENQADKNDQKEYDTDREEYEWGKLWERAYEELSEKEKASLDKFKAGTSELLMSSVDHHSNKKASNGDGAIGDPTSSRKAPDDNEKTSEEQLKHLVQANLNRLKDTEQFEVQIAGHSIKVQDEFRRIVHGITTVKDVVSAAISGEPHASVVWAGILVGLNLFLNPIAQSESAASGLSLITDLLIRYRIIEEGHQQYHAQAQEKSQEDGLLWLKKSMVSVYVQIWRYQILFARTYFRSSFSQFLRDIVIVDDWESLIKSIQETNASIVEYLNIKSNMTILGIRKSIENYQSETVALVRKANDQIDKLLKSNLWDKLQPRTEAEYNSRIQKQVGGECLAGTQLPMLHQIQSWIEKPDAQPIFWLHGMAGTGKSTLARTVAARLDQGQRIDDNGRLDSEVRLGGSFFFRRTYQGRDYTGALIRTLAAQLLYTLPGFARHVQHVIEEKSFAVADRSLFDQWNELVLGPLQELGKSRRSRLTVFFVVDALDECQPESLEVSTKPGEVYLRTDIEDIVGLLGHVRKLEGTHIQIRIFVTSRPTETIDRHFGHLSTGDYSGETLLKIPLPDIDGSRVDDISRFVESELMKIRREHRMEANWPGKENTYELVKMADGLFIFAATACLFLKQGKAKERLKMIFNKKIEGNSPQSHLDQLYHDVLKAEVIGHGLLKAKRRKK